MEKENIAQENMALGCAAQGAEAQKTEGAAVDLGKFKSVDALLNAYNSLEAEFTRRSQRLRELEGKQAGENVQPPAGKGETKTETVEGKSSQSFAGAVQEAVEAYLAGRQAPYIMADGGSFAAAPAARVRSLEEAGRLAQEMFRKNG